MLLYGLPSTPLGMATFFLNGFFIDVIMVLFIASQIPLRRNYLLKKHKLSAKWLFIVLMVACSTIGRLFWFPVMQERQWAGALIYFSIFAIFLFFFGKKMFFALGYYFMVDCFFSLGHCVLFLFSIPSKQIPIWGHADYTYELFEYFLNGLVVFLFALIVCFCFPRLQQGIHFRWWHIALLLLGAQAMNTFLLNTITEPNTSPLRLWVFFLYLIFTFVFFYFFFYKIQLRTLAIYNLQLTQMNALYENYYLQTQQNSRDFQKCKQNIAAGVKCLYQHAQNEQSLQADIARLYDLQCAHTPYFFCENPVVDAVLISKMQQIKEKDIDFQIDIQLPKTLFIENVHLASLLTNVLDNAIEACGHVQTKRTIVLLGKVENNQLVIRCENSCLPHAKPQRFRKKHKHRGHGLSIMRAIVHQYQGHLHVECTNERFIWLGLVPLPTQHS